MARGHLRKRGKKSWRLAVYLGVGPDGKKQYHYETFKGNKKDAEKRLGVVVNEVNNNTFVVPTKMTLEAFLTQWLDAHVRHSVEQKTYEQYEGLCRLHIIPELGHIRLENLNPLDLQNFYSKKLTAPRADGRPGTLSPTTIKRMHDVLKIALNQAVRWQMIPRNVADLADPPKTRRKEIRVWTPEQAAQFLASVEKDPYYAAYLLALTVGLRRGEILGLRWRDVDWARSAVTIRQTIVRADKGVIIKPTKTTGSQATIAIPLVVLDALKIRILKQREAKITYESAYGSDAWETGDLIFTNPKGRYLDPHSFSKGFQRKAKKAGLPVIRFHDLRHTSATFMMQTGAHVRSMMDQLRHSQVSTTVNTYTHSIKPLQHKVAEDVADLIGLGDKPSTATDSTLVQ